MNRLVIQDVHDGFISVEQNQIWSVDNADYFRWSNMEHLFSYEVAHVWVPKE